VWPAVQRARGAHTAAAADAVKDAMPRRMLASLRKCCGRGCDRSAPSHRDQTQTMECEMGEIVEVISTPTKSPSDLLSGLLGEDSGSPPPRDHVLYLARMIPAQTLSKTEPLYHPSTRCV
jgi:hypothetical protein